MKQLMMGLVLSACLCTGLTAQVKMAILNTQKALLDTAEIKKAQADLEAKFKPRTEAMRKTDLQAGAGKLTPQVEADLTSQGQRRQRDLQRMQEDLQADVERDRQEILSKASLRMQEVIKKLAEEKGLDVVVDTSNTIYFKPTLDVTAEATAAYDKAHPSK
jgi:outer membrane protein